VIDIVGVIENAKSKVTKKLTNVEINQNVKRN